MTRGRVLIADPHPTTRLVALDALRDHWEVMPLADDEDPVRATRKARPVLLLLGVPPGRSQGALRACRSLKTEASPPRVALLDRAGKLSDPEQILEDWLADGVLCGSFEAAELRKFVEDVLAGRRPVVRGSAPGRGLLSRILGR
jgi:DNA-binding NarL/FixJ family response regulator